MTNSNSNISNWNAICIYAVIDSTYFIEFLTFFFSLSMFFVFFLVSCGSLSSSSSSSSSCLPFCAQHLNMMMVTMMGMGNNVSIIQWKIFFTIHFAWEYGEFTKSRQISFYFLSFFCTSSLIFGSNNLQCSKGPNERGVQKATEHIFFVHLFKWFLHSIIEHKVQFEMVACTLIELKSVTGNGILI